MAMAGGNGFNAERTTYVHNVTYAYIHPRWRLDTEVEYYRQGGMLHCCLCEALD